MNRRLPIGAEVSPEGGAHFRVWAPQHDRVEVILEKDTGASQVYELGWEMNGYFSGLVAEAVEGTLYRYRLDGEEELFPDPASRFQPSGPGGPSQVIDPGHFSWTDQEWPGVSIDNQVMYEMHVGTFTLRGNWESAIQELTRLAELGITIIEVMPVAEFAGSFGWSYDGVDIFAPTHLYGQPDDFRAFVDKAHARGLGIILDVVYNHLGPVNNYLRKFSNSYFSEKYHNDWGEAINFDGEDSPPVREFFTANAGYWIDEYHLDGLRIDATQQMYDASPENILSMISRKVKEAAGKRKTIVVAESETQQVKIILPSEENGYGLDAVWNDDFHHSAKVALTGHSEAYYSEYLGHPQEFISCLKWGYLYQGQYYRWQKQRRGTPSLGLKPSVFILYIQNHDQIANSSHGLRVHSLTSPGLFRAMTTLLLLAPGTPMLFQGQEFAASSPFFYFSNVSPDLAESIHQSRIKLLSQFGSLALPGMKPYFARPDDPQTFARSKLNPAERQQHAEAYSLHSDLLKLRREEPAFHAQRKGGMDGAVLSSRAFILRYFSEQGDDRLLIINLGPDLHLDHLPEPLLAPPENCIWEMRWSSEDPRYGGSGTVPIEEDNWRIPGQTAIVLKPKNV